MEELKERVHILEESLEREKQTNAQLLKLFQQSTESIEKKLDALLSEKNKEKETEVVELRKTVELLIALQNDSHYKVMGLLEEKFSGFEEKMKTFNEQFSEKMNLIEDKQEDQDQIVEGNAENFGTLVAEQFSSVESSDSQTPLEVSNWHMEIPSSPAAGFVMGLQGEGFGGVEEVRQAKEKRLMDIKNLINVGFSWAKERISIEEEYVLIDKKKFMPFGQFYEDLKHRPWTVFPKDYEFKCDGCHHLSSIVQIEKDKIHCKCVNCSTMVIAEQPKAGHEWITCDFCKDDIQMTKDSWMHNDAICPECGVRYALEPTPDNLLVKPQCIHN